MGSLTVAVFLVALAVCNFGFAGWAVCELRDRFRLLAANQAPPPAPLAPSWKPILAKLRAWCRKRSPQTA